MSDYLQETKEAFIEKMTKMGIIDKNGAILNKQGYIDWLKEKEKRIHSQIIHHSEPGGYDLNLLHKDLEIVQEMLSNVTNIEKLDREQEIIERYVAKQEKRNARIQDIKEKTKNFIRLFTFQKQPTPEYGK